MGDVYELAKDFSEKTSRAIFLTGKAGTGKTTFLRQLRGHTLKQIAVVAPTGVAAINAGGVTIHSFFQLPFTPFAPTEEGRNNLVRKMKMSSIRRKVLQQLEILVIDEISMVRADVLDAIDTILRHFRYRRNEPFGGVQVVYIGDLYQLPPVVVPEEWDVIKLFYRTPFFFDSHVVQEQPPVYIELDKIFRQKNADFVRMLNEVRNNALTREGLRLLQSRYEPDFKLADHPDYIFLTTHNAMANRINREEMDKLAGKPFIFSAVIRGDFPEKNYPNDPELELKVGAKVMFIANDTKYPRRYYNGKIGTITHLDEKHIHILCDEDEGEIDVERELWENIRYNVNKQSGQIEENTLGTYTQFPLRLAWAITIHKSQGLTFDKAIIDAAYSFSSGQVYVALSRCRSLEGLVLTSPIRSESLDVDKAVVDYSYNKLHTEQLQQELKTAQHDYDELVVKNVFNFHFALGQATHLQSVIRKNSQQFNDEGREHADLLRTTVFQIKQVADKFQMQLHQLFSENDSQLDERLEAAAHYFEKELGDAMMLATNSPAEVFDFDLAKEYKEELKMLYNELSIKQFLICRVAHHACAEEIHKLRSKFKIPHFSLKLYDAFAEDNIEKPKKAKRTGKPKKSEEEKKAEKKPSHQVTLEMFRKERDVAKIAGERNLVYSTVENHLCRCIQEGALTLDEFVPPEFQQAIRELSGNGMGTTDIFSSMEGNVTYNQIRAVLQSKEENN